MHLKPKGHLLQEEKGLLKKILIHSREGYRCKIQRQHNPFLGVPSHTNTLWNQSAPPAREISPLQKKSDSQSCGISLPSPKAAQPISWCPEYYRCSLNSKSISCRRTNKTFGKEDFHCCVGNCGNLKLYGSSWSQLVSLAYDSILPSSMTHIKMNIFPSFLTARVY